MRVRIVLVLALAAVPALAQGQGPLRLMESAKAKERAWGAYHAGEQRMRDAIPALRRLAREDPQAVRRRALDALIRLQAEVDLQELAPLGKRHPTEAFILLALHPKRNADGLLRFVTADAPPLPWLAACNLLATAKDPRLAGRLLENLRLKLHLTVVDGDELCIGLGGGAGGRFCGRIRIPAGWPPLAVYALTERQSADSRPLAPGLFPVYYERKLIVTTGGRGSSMSSFDRDARRVAYLAQLLDQPRLPIEPTRARTIRWQDGASFRREAGEIVRKCHADYREVLARLVAKKLLTEEARRALRPPIELLVADWRKDKSEPLPHVAVRENAPPAEAGGAESE